MSTFASRTFSPRTFEANTFQFDSPGFGTVIYASMSEGVVFSDVETAITNLQSSISDSILLSDEFSYPGMTIVIFNYSLYITENKNFNVLLWQNVKY